MLLLGSFGHGDPAAVAAAAAASTGGAAALVVPAVIDTLAHNGKEHRRHKQADEDGR